MIKSWLKFADDANCDLLSCSKFLRLNLWVKPEQDIIFFLK